MFFTRSTCEKLLAIGCVSSSIYIYDCMGNIAQIDYCSQLSCKLKHTRAFPASAIDFIAPSEQAKKNAELRWGNDLTCYDCGEKVGPPLFLNNIQIGTGLCSCSRQFENNIPAYEFHRHNIVDLPPDEVEGYIVKGLS